MSCKTFTGLVAGAFLACAGAASAATLNVNGSGILTGASNVDVNGTLYDVSFVSGICGDFYNGCDEASDFDFSDETTALAAAQALLDQVLLDISATELFDSQPTTVAGCAGAISCFLFVPWGYSVPHGAAQTVYLVNASDEGSDGTTFGSLVSPTTDWSLVGGMGFARFEVAAVPLPASALLLIAGLGGLGLVRRRG